ncbi:hypothetical protein [Tessaracoccus sp. MC1756]|uniref:hypothetical protein n=1 Tax=Tessaracoccus sp. MC1756 TaxID=2760311 RepID=UPI0016036EA6|nr:hypothetical protein [Tessaracoccus sp. MC1756]MBB1509141.1 hypothetical protein [Tessaracoccus sp. MC1756]
MTDDDFDDEILAPPTDVVAEAAAVADDSHEWHPSHGFADARLAVRIWVDEDVRQLTKVHVSPRWREILGPNRTLEDAFEEAFFAASLRSAGASDPLDFTVLPEPTPDPESTLTWDDFDAVQERIVALGERQAALRDRPDHEIRWADIDGEKTVAQRGPVSVSLTWSGLAEAVRFDRNWLRTATPEHISAAVLQTARSAYANYHPPHFVPGEHEELAGEFFQAQRDLLTIMAKGTR